MVLNKIQEVLGWSLVLYGSQTGPGEHPEYGLQVWKVLSYTHTPSVVGHGLQLSRTER